MHQRIVIRPIRHPIQPRGKPPKLAPAERRRLPLQKKNREDLLLQHRPGEKLIRHCHHKRHPMLVQTLLFQTLLFQTLLFQTAPF